MDKSFSDGIMNFRKSFEESIKIIKELISEQLMMEAQIAQLASSSTTWQTESSPLSPSIQPDMDINTVILASEEECDNFSVCVDDVFIDKEEDRAISDEIYR